MKYGSKYKHLVKNFFSRPSTSIEAKLGEIRGHKHRHKIQFTIYLSVQQSKIIPPWYWFSQKHFSKCKFHCFSNSL